MNIEPLSIDSIKFNTCKFRSENQISRIVKRCSCQGGNYELSGFICNKKEIFQITEEICKTCEVYESK